MTKLEVAAHEYACKHIEMISQLVAMESFKAGAEWMADNLWHDAQSDDLPPIDEEVIVLCDNGKVCFGHRPDPKGWWGRRVAHGQREHFEPQTYGKGGWNIPDVKYWLDCSLPKLEEKMP